MTHIYASCEDVGIRTMEALRASKDMPATDRVDVLFAPDKAYDACRQYAAAFERIRAANDTERARFGFAGMSEGHE